MTMPAQTIAFLLPRPVSLCDDCWKDRPDDRYAHLNPKDHPEAVFLPHPRGFIAHRLWQLSHASFDTFCGQHWVRPPWTANARR